MKIRKQKAENKNFQAQNVSAFRFLLSVFCFLFFVFSASAQLSSLKVSKIEIKHVGPPASSDDLIRANIRVKVGEPFLRAAVDDDVRNLYATGLFANIRVADDITPDGVVLTYIVQGKPRLTAIKFQGSKKFSDSRLLKKVTSKVGEPLDERKLFTDSLEIQKMYQKAGYPGTAVKYVPNVDENAGRAVAVFEITESPKIKITKVEFVGAQAFSQKQLRKQIKTRKHWWMSWITGSGVFKDDQFQDDKEKLTAFYRDKGYIDFEIKDVRFEHPTPRTMTIRFVIYEGRQYKVGSVKFTGNKLFSAADIAAGIRRAQPSGILKKAKLGPNGLPMDVGDIFTPKGLTDDEQKVTDFYGAKGYIDVATSARGLVVVRIPNTDTGTMDLDFQIDEGQKSYIEKIEIRGNTKTKDQVLRRELAVAPGEVFDMVRVKVSKQRLEGLQYFEKVDARPETTDVPNRKNLIIGVEEKNTGNLTVGAGINSDSGLVGFVEVSQGNFDLFHPPTFTGGGQKIRLRAQLGTQQQDYEISFIEPWFLGKKLQFSADLYDRDLKFQSLESLYDESRVGGRVGLTRALGSDFLIGSSGYTIEDVGILFNGQAGGRGTSTNFPGVGPTVPTNLLNEAGYAVVSKFDFSLAYDTRNSVQLPDKGQRTELTAIIAGPFGGQKDFYKLELKTAWYFKGFFPNHVLELVGETGVADSYGSSSSVPFYERYYLGGLYSMRGFRYRSVSPREPGSGSNEPIGGDTYWFGSAEYSIPIFQSEKEHGVGMRFAFFYDIGNVMLSPYDYSFSGYDDNWGLGLRLNLPIGPLRLDYGIPLHHDQFNSSSGQFQFGVGYTREF